MINGLKSKKIIAGIVDAKSEISEANILRFNQSSAVMAFMNTKSPILADQKMRQAIIQSIKPGLVSTTLGYPTTSVRSPILKDQIGYKADIIQQPYNSEAANAQFTSLGWQWSEGDPYRKKDGKELTLQFVSENTPEYAKMSEELQKQLALVGVKLNVTLESPEDLSAETLSTKAYDILLYAINIGADPDVYVYWHSSQAKPDAKPGFNFSVYESAVADRSLEDGRSRVNQELRAIKYQPFLEAWKTDVPAIGFHQPRLSYTVTVPVYNLNEMTINSASERFRNVQNWQINTQNKTTE
jgi:peptide/nickel transport system substrate-binding protein